MFKWLEKFVVKKIVKRVINTVLDNEEEVIVFVEEHLDEITEKAKNYLETKVASLVKKAYETLRDTQE